MQALWRAFLELNATRAPAMAGAAPITYAELVAWQQAYGVTLTPWEVDTIRALDACALEASTDVSPTARR